MPEIIEFVTSEYDVEFPIFNKIPVIGEHADPVFKHLIGRYYIFFVLLFYFVFTQEGTLLPNFKY